jgi:hypothetical protein
MDASSPRGENGQCGGGVTLTPDWRSNCCNAKQNSSLAGRANPSAGQIQFAFPEPPAGSC